MDRLKGTSDEPADLAAELFPLPDDLLAEPTPTDQLRPPVTQRPPLLPFDQLPWESFELLLVEVARVVEGVTRARRYGRSGQKQDGIDIYGRLPDDRYVLY
jgi:hypothetical protein